MMTWQYSIWEKCIAKVANKANLGEKTKRQAISIINEVRRKDTEISYSAGKNPMGLAATILYLSCLKMWSRIYIHIQATVLVHTTNWDNRSALGEQKHYYFEKLNSQRLVSHTHREVCQFHLYLVNQ